MNNSIQIEALESIEDVIRGDGNSAVAASDKKSETKPLTTESNNNENSFRTFLASCLNLTNLLIFVFLFSVASFDFYMINFYLKYIPGNIFINTLVSASSATIASYITGLIILKLGS